jgi:hypothetical protein
MTQVTPPIGDSKGYPEPEQVDRLLAVAFSRRQAECHGRPGRHKRLQARYRPGAGA